MPDSEAPPNAVTGIALIAAWLGAIACLWTSWCIFPALAWNELRVAPAFALRHGINPYPSLGGGPLFTLIYGPVVIVIDLPTTFATSPAGALHIASLITALMIAGPLAVIFFRSSELRARGTWAPWLALALGILLRPETHFLFQVSDQSAIAFGLLSGWCLARHPQPGTSWLIGAAALCTLAIFSKQLAVFLVPAQLVFLWLGGNRAAALRFLAWVILFGAAALVICVEAFGFNNLWINLVAIPARLPWSNFAVRFATRPWSLFAQVALPSLALLVLWFSGHWPKRSKEGGRFFQFAALAFLAMLPLGLMAFFKIGGDTNNLHSWGYLLAGALLAWLAKPSGRAATSIVLVIVTVFALALHAGEFASLRPRPLSEHFTVADKLIGAYPHALWFPQNPLITFYADGKLWHSEDGARTRGFAGYMPNATDFRRDLPANLQAIVYPANENLSLSALLLPEFNQKTSLPHWTLLTRPAPTTAP